MTIARSPANARVWLTPVTRFPAMAPQETEFCCLLFKNSDHVAATIRALLSNRSSRVAGHRMALGLAVAGCRRPTF
jgi:hypothetical protein